ncbi:MAG TPA: methyltransferase type 11 [Syntrophaceae bacterium]|jgi:2-polyprenyl-3-methyl-5-hydroxy-6-metoxy-1,4-benzoquinol methylase|nr:methyltransferase type 11 [Syntrophaceae bacterium]
MKVIVAIANHGTRHASYVQRLIDEYRSMPYEVAIVILSNIPKDFGHDVEVKVGLPEKNPRSLPFGHKQLFADRKDDYDLFIYSEDDTLITQRNIEAFLETQADLPVDHIAGFLRYEEDSHGNRFCSSMHSHFHWRPGSLRKYRRHYYAYFTNMHSACFILTKEQLKRCIASGEFLVRPHEGRYALLESAATDPYTQCGLKKVICISRIDDFLLHHLPNDYLGHLGLPFDEMRIQIKRMLELGETYSSDVFIPEHTGLDIWRWEKCYYDHADKGLIEILPDKAHMILSIGCGRGQTEYLMAESGRTVEVIPLDDYISTLAEKRGLICLSASWKALFDMPKEKKYDLIYLSDILCYIQDPISVLQACKQHLRPNGQLLLSFHNFDSIKNIRYKKLKSDSVNLNFCTSKMVRRWIEVSGFKVSRIYAPVIKKVAVFDRISLGLFRNRLSAKIAILASLI